MRLFGLWTWTHRLRVLVLDASGVPKMPYTPMRARLLTEGKERSWLSGTWDLIG